MACRALRAVAGVSVSAWLEAVLPGFPTCAAPPTAASTRFLSSAAAVSKLDAHGRWPRAYLHPDDVEYIAQHTARSGRSTAGGREGAGESAGAAETQTASAARGQDAAGPASANDHLHNVFFEEHEDASDDEEFDNSYTAKSRNGASSGAWEWEGAGGEEEPAAFAAQARRGKNHTRPGPSASSPNGAEPEWTGAPRRQHSRGDSRGHGPQSGKRQGQEQQHTRNPAADQGPGGYAGAAERGQAQSRTRETHQAERAQREAQQRRQQQLQQQEAERERRRKAQQEEAARERQRQSAGEAEREGWGRTQAEARGRRGVEWFNKRWPYSRGFVHYDEYEGFDGYSESYERSGRSGASGGGGGGKHYRSAFAEEREWHSQFWDEPGTTSAGGSGRGSGASGPNSGAGARAGGGTRQQDFTARWWQHFQARAGAGPGPGPGSGSSAGAGSGSGASSSTHHHHQHRSHPQPRPRLPPELQAHATALGLDPHGSAPLDAAAVKAAFRARAKETHPDLHAALGAAGKAAAEERFKRVHAAYQALSKVVGAA